MKVLKQIEEAGEAIRIDTIAELQHRLKDFCKTNGVPVERVEYNDSEFDFQIINDSNDSNNSNTEDT